MKIKTDTGAIIEVKDEVIAQEILDNTIWTEDTAKTSTPKKQKVPIDD